MFRKPTSKRTHPNNKMILDALNIRNIPRLRDQDASQHADW